MSVTEGTSFRILVEVPVSSNLSRQGDAVAPNRSCLRSITPARQKTLGKFALGRQYLSSHFNSRFQLGARYNAGMPAWNWLFMPVTLE
jgi:hypothetical protein